jgi:type I restriction enzyme R subunit
LGGAAAGAGVEQVVGVGAEGGGERAGGGVDELDGDNLPELLELKYKGVRDAAAELGGVARIRETFVGFQRHLYD